MMPGIQAVGGGGVRSNREGRGSCRKARLGSSWAVWAAGQRSLGGNGAHGLGDTFD